MCTFFEPLVFLQPLTIDLSKVGPSNTVLLHSQLPLTKPSVSCCSNPAAADH
jgi:hypothetical protein